MDIIINSKEFDRVLQKVIPIKDLVTRDDEKAILFSIRGNKLLIEAVKNQQFQICFFVDILSNNKPQEENNDFYILFFQLERLRKVLKEDERLNLFIINNALNIKSEINGSVVLDLYNNQEAHENMRLIELNTPIPATFKINEWNILSKKIPYQNNQLLFEFNHKNQTVNISGLFEVSSFFTLNSVCSSTDESSPLIDMNNFAITAECSKFNFIKSFNNPIFTFLEDINSLYIQDELGIVIIRNTEYRNEELQTVNSLIELKEENNNSQISIPQNQLESALLFQSFNLGVSDSINLQVDGEFLLIKGNESKDPAKINCIEVGDFIESDINYSILNIATNLTKYKESTIIDIYQCKLMLEGDDEPILYFVIEEELSNNLKLRLFFYSIVQQS